MRAEDPPARDTGARRVEPVPLASGGSAPQSRHTPARFFRPVVTGTGLFDRHDAVLLVGLAGALLIVFAHPLVRALDLAQDIDDTRLALVPALAVLVFALLCQQHGKRQFRQARIAAGDAVRSRERTDELGELVVFGRSLARAQDLEAVRDAILQHLCRLARSDDTWVMFRADGVWKAIVGASRDGVGVEDLYGATADRVVAAAGGTGSAVDAVDIDGGICLPMLAAGAPIGVVGIPGTLADLPESRRRLLTTAAALLAISVKNVQCFREMRDQSLRDGLTGCFNRTYALEAIEIELRRSRRGARPTSLIMFDLDRFKEVNDRYGHLCGDHVLAAVGRLMREVLRGSDVTCRYGGDEFLVLLPETPIEGARRVAEGLRRDVAALAFDWNGEAVQVTGSFGVSAAPPGAGSTQELVARADAALYQAKSTGRNCSVLSDSVLDRTPGTEH